LKRTTSELSRVHPSIQTHATLSPVPHFMKWLSKLQTIPKNVSLTNSNSSGRKAGSYAAVNIPSHVLGDIRMALQSMPPHRDQDLDLLTESEVMALLYSTLNIDGWYMNEHFCSSIKQSVNWLFISFLASRHLCFHVCDLIAMVVLCYCS
jgi:hypothetical protein